MAGSSTTQADLSISAPEFCVGQDVSFVPIWNDDQSGNSDPPITYVDNAWWHLPDKFVNEPYSYSTYCNSYRRNDIWLTYPTTHCWYVNGTGGACSTRQTLHFSNGQSVNIAAAGSFTVYRPQTKLDADSIYKGHVAVLSSGQWFPGSVLTSGDVQFNAIVTSLDFPGEANWTQLICRETTGDGMGLPLMLQFNTYGDHRLDNALFYNTGNTVIASGKNTTVTFGDDTGIGAGTGDRPEVGIYATSFESVADDFKTYLVFKPAGDGIFVTLGRVDWGWSGYAAFDTIGLKWNLITGANGLPAMSNPDEFPTWPKVYHGSKDP
jgi:hypothetical protein